MSPLVSSSISLPISALLAPHSQPNLAPNLSLPSPSTAILGPLPPTTPLHLALNWLALSDLPEYESVVSALQSKNKTGAAQESAIPDSGATTDVKPAVESGGKKRKRQKPERVLLITGRKDEMYQSLQDDDEDWMRDHGSDYSVLERLKRVDIRYCPSPEHLKLLLSLLTVPSPTSTANPISTTDRTFNLESPPGLVILWDLAGLLMEWEAVDENEMMYEDMQDDMLGLGEPTEPRLVFKKGVKVSDYLDMIAVGRATADHFSQIDTSKPQTQLIILEPNLDFQSSLPVLLAPADPANIDNTMSSQVRQKRIKLQDGLKWMLGEEAIGIVSEYQSMTEDPLAPHYQLEFPSDADKTAYMTRRRCGRGEWARPTFREGDTDGDRGGWRWEWA